MKKTDADHPTAPGAALNPGRRAVLGGLGAFATLALVREVRGATRPRRTAAARWVDRQQEIAQALAAGQIAPRRWMEDVEALAREVDVAELMAYADRQQVRDAPAASNNDPHKRYVRFLDAEGQPRRLAYGVAFFDFGATNVVTPHGHRHMASAHLVVAGRFRIRNYDRIGDEEGAMLIRPTRDYIWQVGDVSTMSSQRDNIHWFVPRGGPARTFDVVVSDLDPGMPSYEIRAIDPYGGEQRADGVIRAPILGFDAAAARYTADV
jgi:hypothetical protein